MLDVMTRNWWMLALRGVFAIIFGILILISPPAAVATFVVLFAIYAIVDGVLGIWSVLSGETSTHRWLHIIEGIIGILAGIFAFAYPGMTAIIMLYIIAAWSILTGAIQVWTAIELRKQIEGEFWLGLSGVLSIIFGILLILFPGTGILTVLLLVSIYSIVFGAMLLMLGFKLRGMRDQTGQPTNKPLSGTV
jgi:uncharacterized membrane protein HdeD (DUF308 family)